MVSTVDLEAYYKFNNNGLDSSGKGRHLTFNGTEAYASGKFNNGYSLPGVDTNSATGPADAALDFSGVGARYTISVWVNFTSVSGEQTIVEKFVGAEGPGWTLTKLSTQAFRFGGNSPGFVNTATGLATAGSFLHLVVRSNGTTIELFLNGSSIGTGSGVISPTSNPLLIGEREGIQSFPVNGVIDEVILWSRDLSNTEIAELYGGGGGLQLPLPSSSTPFRYVRSLALTSRPSTPFRWVKGPEVPWPLLRSPQVAYRTLTTDRLIDVPVDVLASLKNFDLTQTRVSTIYEAPAAQFGFVLGIFVKITAVDTLTVVPQISVGITSGENDIFANEPLTGISAVDDVWSNWLVLSKARVSLNSEQVKLNITGATANKLLANIYLLGFEH
jgi:hypothetical protein